MTTHSSTMPLTTPSTMPLTTPDRRNLSFRYWATIAAVFLVASIGTFLVTVGCVVPATNRIERGFLDSSLRKGSRRLPGYDFNADQLMGAEAGFALAVILLLLAFVCLCRCCCRGGGCSLCDLLACVCLYEMCCDDGQIGDFQLF